MSPRPWHKRWHTKRMADAGYLSMTMEQRGVDDTLWNMAGQSQEQYGTSDGSITIGTTRRLKVKQLVETIIKPNLKI